MLGVDKERLEDELGMSVSKLCREGADVNDRYIMSEMFLESKFSDKLKYVIYGVDLCTFTSEGLSANSYKLFYPFIDYPAANEYVRLYSNCSEYLINKFIKVSRFNDDVTKNAAIRGLMSDWSNKKHGQIDIEKYKMRLENHDERRIMMQQNLMNIFEKNIRMFTDRGIKVILVYVPTLDLLNEYEPEKFTNICNWYAEFANNNPLVEYWDFNPEYSHRYDIFYDRLHLNASGQQLLTTAIINRFQNNDD